MSKKFWCSLFIISLVLVIINIVIATNYDNPGGDTSAAETDASPAEGGSSGTNPTEGGSEGEGDGTTRYEGDTDYYACNPNTVPCSFMNMDIRIYCYDDVRTGIGNDEKFVMNNVYQEYGLLFQDQSQYVDSGDVSLAVNHPVLAENLNNLDENSFSAVDQLFENTAIYYQWITDNDHGLPSVSLELNPESSFDKAKLYRFEGKKTEYSSEDTRYKDAYSTGGCTPYVYFYYQMNYTSNNWFGFEWDGDYFSAANPYYNGYYKKDLGFDVIWDENQDQCGAIGGAWLNTDGLYQDSSGNGYKCCGDDAIWLENKVVSDDKTLTENEINEISAGTVSQSLYCLYTTLDVGSTIAVLPLAEAGTGVWSYYCTPTNFETYDPTLDFDNSYDASDGAGEEVDAKRAPFFFNQSGVVETDIGKWSDYNGENPYFCNEISDENQRKSFEWIDINTAGEESQHSCEDLLGGKWTGSHCCGNKYDYEDAETSSYDANGDVGYVDESFSETTPIYYAGSTIIIADRLACVDAEVIEGVNQQSTEFPSHTAQKTGTDDKGYELLNVNGTLYGCNIDNFDTLGKDWYTKNTLITTATNTNKCDVREGTYLCNYNYTNPDDARWDWYAITTRDDEGNYVKDTLGYNSEDANTFTWSAPSWAAEDQQDGACCAGNRCWDGTSCVDEYTEHDYTDATGETQHYICNNGDWGGGVETKYDWYNNTDAAAIDYCVNPYSCVCSSNEDDETFCVEEGDYYEAGCTLKPDFFKNDHFCEAINPQDTDGNGIIDDADSSRWTSRTKFLAFQLMQIAEAKTTDYTLFCDKYTDTLNNYVDVEAIAEKINSFCILKQDDAVTIGVTFNSDDNEEPMTVDANSLLFEGSTAFITQILGQNDISSCDTAVNTPAADRFGDYYSCDGSTAKYWYNNVTKTFIYSKDGLEYTGALPYPEIGTYQNMLDDKKKQITDYIDGNTLKNPAGNELNGAAINYFAGFDYVEDYNKLYLDYDATADTITVGFEDVKYLDGHGNRYFLGVIYDGLNIDCSQVYAPYETTATIFCDTDAGIVLEESPTGSAYWNSLTAAVRMG